MKIKYKITALLIALLLLSSNCQPTKKVEDKTLYLLILGAYFEANCIGTGRFWVRNLVTNNSECINTTLKASGKQVNIYVDNKINPALDYSYIQQQFDDLIKPNSDSAFGPVSDIDHNGKTEIVITDINDGSTPSTGYVAGFFDPINFYADDASYKIRSNQKEILYLDGVQLVNSLTKYPTNFVSTIAHEFQHLIRFQYIINQDFDDPTWVNEGTSEVASEISYGIETARLNCFNGNTCSNGVNGIAILNWQSTLQHYAYSYAFMSYLYNASGTNKSDKFKFIKSSVVGDSSGVRANTTDNLVNVFKSSAPTYASANFPDTTNATIYKTILASFFGQGAGYASGDTIYYGASSPITNASAYSKMVTFYPMDTSLKSGIGSGLPKSNSTITSLYPNAPARYASNSTGSTNSDMVTIKDSNSDYIVVNGSLTSTGNYSYTPSITEPVTMPILTLTESGAECPIDHIIQLNRIEKQLMNLNERKLINQ